VFSKIKPRKNNIMAIGRKKLLIISPGKVWTP
jgi:hypothetical protein